MLPKFIFKILFLSLLQTKFFVANAFVIPTTARARQPVSFFSSSERSKSSLFLDEAKKNVVKPSITSTSLNSIVSSWPSLSMDMCRGGATAAVAAATTATATSTFIPLPVKTILLSTLLPTCIGFYKYEYGVSYAYGTATSLTSFLMLRNFLSSSSSSSVALPSSLKVPALLHASALIFYGIRLNLFLLYRELFIPRFREFRERIEKRQTDKEEEEKENGESDDSTESSSVTKEEEEKKSLILSTVKKRLMNRTPFILSCSVLYQGLISPVYISILSAENNIMLCPISSMVYKSLIGLTWFGFLLAAVGDLTKTVVKGRQQKEDYLVTNGVFRFFRHPNYTGEIISWSSSYLASLFLVLTSFFSSSSSSGVGYGVPLLVLLGFLGVSGMTFVLLNATKNLEKKQKEKYGDLDEYDKWIESSWCGFSL